jgi:hypothetical protein
MNLGKTIPEVEKTNEDLPIIVHDAFGHSECD